MELIIKPATDEETIEALENTIESLQQQTDQKEKKYTGYGYHGGGRKPKGEESRTCTMSIVCTASEKAMIKKLASNSGLTISGFVLAAINYFYEKELKH
jgi:NAD-dependent DNA ligase